MTCHPNCYWRNAPGTHGSYSCYTWARRLARIFKAMSALGAVGMYLLLRYHHGVLMQLFWAGSFLTLLWFTAAIVGVRRAVEQDP